MPRTELQKSEDYIDVSEYDEYMAPTSENGASELQKAVYQDDFHRVKLIVQRDGRSALKQTDVLKNTALHTACYFGKVSSTCTSITTVSNM